MYFLGPITLIKISNDQQQIAYANKYGDVAIHSLKSFVTKSNSVRLPNQAHCTSLYWHYTDSELYCGDSTGNVSVINLSFIIRNLVSIGISPILLLDSAIVQIDGFNEYLLVSSQTKTILCNNELQEFKQIGNRPRDGQFGACFSIDFESLESQERRVTTIDEYENLLMENVRIYCSRPGMRLWQVNLDGVVLKTHQFKNSNLSAQRVHLLNENHEPDSSPSLMDKTNQFQIAHALNNIFIFTWNSCGFYIVDPRESKILFWTTEFNGRISTAKVVGGSVFLYLNDGSIMELKFLKLQQYVLQLCRSESYIEACDVIKNNLEYFMNVVRMNREVSDMNQYKIFLKIRDHLIANGYNEMLDNLKSVFDELTTKKIQNVVILSKHFFNSNKSQSQEKEESPHEKVEQQVLAVTNQLDDLQVMSTAEMDRSVKQLYIIYQTSLISNLNYRERVAKIFDSLKSSMICRIMSELEMLLIDNDDYEPTKAKRVVCKMFLDYLQPEIIFEIEDEKTLNFIADALVQVQCEEMSVSRCRRCEFPLNCGSNRFGYEEIGNILQQFYWSRKEYEKCFEMCRQLPYLLKITGKFITDERKWDRMIPYAINLGDLEILHKSLELFNDISLFHQLLDDYCMASIDGKFRCLKCDETNDIAEVHKILTWDCLFQAIEYYLSGQELLELLVKYSQFIPNGAISRQFYVKLLLHASD